MENEKATNGSGAALTSSAKPQATNPHPGIVDGYTTGEIVTLGGHTFVLPPLKLKTLKQAMREGLMEKVLALGELDGSAGAGFADRVDDFLVLLLKALQRNYPNLTSEDLDDLVDVPDIGPALERLLIVNGLITRPTTGPAQDQESAAKTEVSPTPDSGSS